MSLEIEPSDICSNPQFFPQPPDPNGGIDCDVATQEFIDAFQSPLTGMNGEGPILNANANVFPTTADQYRENATVNDFKLYNGLGVARPYSKPDSMGGSTGDGFYGWTRPTKMFGRDSKSYDLNYKREEMIERARMGFKKMGFKPNEVPKNADFKEWVWNNNQALGIGGTPIGNPNQYNRNYPLPDADGVARRLYDPTPSRRTKMLSTDIEKLGLMPQRTMMNPVTVVANDRQREFLMRVPRNADVIESVLYENIHPRGMGSKVEAPRVYDDQSVVRQPVGSNETADKSVLGIWRNGFSEVNPLLDSSLEDLLVQHKNQYVFVEGKQPGKEHEEFLSSYDVFSQQFVPDTFKTKPTEKEYPRMASTSNGPMFPPPRGVGNEFYNYNKIPSH